jgi:hypothetical protein
MSGLALLVLTSDSLVHGAVIPLAGRQCRSEPFQGAGQAGFHGAARTSQHRCCLCFGKVEEVATRNDEPIHGRQKIDGLEEDSSALLRQGCVLRRRSLGTMWEGPFKPLREPGSTPS